MVVTKMATTSVTDRVPNKYTPHKITWVVLAGGDLVMMTFPR